MKTVDILKGAKNFLKTERLESDKTSAICFAVADYVAATYGVDEFLAPGTPAEEVYDKAQGFVMLRLKSITDSAGFCRKALKAVLGDNCAYSVENLQRARHQWLDSLIKELEDENS